MHNLKRDLDKNLVSDFYLNLNSYRRFPPSDVDRSNMQSKIGLSLNGIKIECLITESGFRLNKRNRTIIYAFNSQIKNLLCGFRSGGRYGIPNINRLI